MKKSTLPLPAAKRPRRLAPRRDLRRAALDAALALVARQGPSALTLEAVAARAGISKGGLLHHFASKEALLTAMVGEVTAGFDRQLRTAAARTHAPGMALAGVHVKRSFAGSGRRSGSAMALLAVAALQPSLMEPVRAYMARRSAAVSQASSHAPEALAAMLIADAVYLFDALGTPVLEGEQRAQVRAVAMRLLQESALSGPVDAAE